jgi:hypothetical protein
MLFSLLSGLRREIIGLCLVAVCVLNAGCGKKGEHPTAKVQGKVTLNGDPLKFGSLLFVPEGNFPSAEGNIRPDGTYDLGTYDTADGAVIAKHKVMITARIAAGAALPEEAVKGAAGTVSAIPERYGDLEKSGLVADVKAGTNTINFELVSAAPKSAE